LAGLDKDLVESDSFTEEIVDIQNQQSSISFEVNQNAFMRRQEDIEDRDLEPKSDPGQDAVKDDIIC